MQCEKNIAKDSERLFRYIIYIRIFIYIYIYLYIYIYIYIYSYIYISWKGQNAKTIMMHQHPLNYFSTYHYFNCVKVKPHRPHSCCPRRVYCQEIKCQSHLDISMDKLEDTKIAKNYRSLREVHCLLLYSIRICGEELITTAPQWWDSRMPGHSLGTTTKYGKFKFSGWNP